MRIHRHWLMMGAAGLAVAAQAAFAQSYPVKPLRMVVTIEPGGAPDIGARLLAPPLGERLGQSVVVENRTGANGNVGGDAVAKARPDGYTLLYGADSLVAINPHVYSRMPFDTLKDIVPVALTTVSQVVISVNPAVPVKTFKEFIDYAKRASPPMAFASGGNASIHHLVMEAVKIQAGIALTHVPFRSGTPAVAAAVAGDVQVVVGGNSAANQIRAGKIRAIVSSGKNRLSYLPDLPTINETFPGVEFNNWLGIWATGGTPDPVVQRLHNEINLALSVKETADKIAAAGGAEVWINSRDFFDKFIRSEHDRYGKIVRALNIRID
ncbi:MAG: Bug family tripartite tricarboxylate transporter substrate binding protein [Burkholderiales bacterium]